MTLYQNPSARRSARQTRGFTLLEILVVLAIIGLLVSLAVANIDRIFGNAKIDAARLFVGSSMKVPLSSYRMHMGDYPSTAEGLTALSTAPAAKADRWRGPYVTDSKALLDPWGHPYQYRFPGTHNKDSYDLYSFGPDGQESADDVGNW
jgi:general secretion pathway protein G